MLATKSLSIALTFCVCAIALHQMYFQLSLPPKCVLEFVEAGYGDATLETETRLWRRACDCEARVVCPKLTTTHNSSKNISKITANASTCNHVQYARGGAITFAKRNAYLLYSFRKYSQRTQIGRFALAWSSSNSYSELCGQYFSRRSASLYPRHATQTFEN